VELGTSHKVCQQEVRRVASRENRHPHRTRGEKGIARAAELMNTNVTQFILDRVVPDAERIVAEKESQKIRLAADAWAELCKRLDAEPKDLPKRSLFPSQSAV